MVAVVMEVTVMPKVDAVPFPQVLLGVTLNVPPVADGPKTNELDGLAVVAVSVTPEPEYVQLYAVALVTAGIEYDCVVPGQAGLAPVIEPVAPTLPRGRERFAVLAQPVLVFVTVTV